MEKVSAYTDRVTETGEWRAGNPGAGQTATPMLADYFNMQQRELLGVLEAAEVEPNINDDNQLAASIWAMLRSALANATEALRGVMRVGTQAEVNAGALDDVAVTPKKLRWGFSISLANNGYIVFPTWLGGLVIQWGLATTPSDSTTTVSVPIAFPTNFWHVLITVRDTVQTYSAAPVGGAVPINLTTFSLRSFYTASGLAYAYIAIGN